MAYYSPSFAVGKKDLTGRTIDVGVNPKEGMSFRIVIRSLLAKAMIAELKAKKFRIFRLGMNFAYFVFGIPPSFLIAHEESAIRRICDAVANKTS